MKIILDPNEPLVRQIREGTGRQLDYSIHIWSATPGGNFNSVMVLRLVEWTLTAATFETEWIDLNVALKKLNREV